MQCHPRSLDLAHFLCHFFLLIFPTAAIALAEDWRLDYGAALALGAPVYALFALGTPIAGWLGDRMDRGMLIAIFFLGCGAASLAAAVSPTPMAFAASLGALGFFAAIYHPVGIALLTEQAPRLGRGLAVNGVFGNMGLACAALTTGVLSEWIGWRSAFVAPALVSIALGLWALHGLRDRSAGPRTASATNPVSASRRDSIATIAVVGAAALFGGLVFTCVTITLPKLFAERLIALDGDLARIGAATAAVFALAAFAQLPVGELLDRWGARPILIALAAAQALLLSAAALTEGWPLAPIALLLVIAMFAEIPVSGWLVGRYAPLRWRSRIVAGEYVLSLGVGALATPAIAALHSGGIGFDRQYLGLGVAALIVTVAATALPSRHSAAKLTPRSTG